MKCTECRWFRGSTEPKRVPGKNPDGCECIAGVICPDLIERAGIEQNETARYDVSYQNDLRGFYN